MMRTGFFSARNRANSSHAALFREQGASQRCNFRQLSHAPELIEVTSVCYRGTAHQDKIQASIRFSRKLQSGDISMVITTAHISPIMSLIAGVLILIVPRLLNLIVAIFLILNGLIGLGVLKWFHM
jgi:hypothetical protein